MMHHIVKLNYTKTYFSFNLYQNLLAYKFLMT